MSKISDADTREIIHGHRKIKSHLGMRGVAASAVVMYHIGFVVGFHFDFERKDFIFGRSYLFVDLFFILSGFIISYANRADRSTAMTSGEAAKFLGNRFARIYPLHFVCLYALVLYNLIISLAGYFKGKQAFADYWPVQHITALIAQTVLVQSAGPSSWIDWNVPSWSISAEIFSYIAFVLLVNLRTRNTPAQMILLVVVPLVFYGYIYGWGKNLDIINGIAPLRCLAGFSLGMLTFYFRGYLDNISRLLLNIMQILGVVVVFFDLAFAWNDLIVIPAFTMLVYCTWSDRGMLSRFLSLQPIQILGEISYSVYLVHVPLIAGVTSISAHVARHFQWIPVAANHAIFICFIFASVYFLSKFTYIYVEQAGRDRVLKILSSTAQKRARV